MKTIWVLFTLVTSAEAAEPRPIQIRLTNTAAVPPGVLYQAKSTASAIFAPLGLKLDWTAAPAGKPIEIRFEPGPPDRPDSLAYAMPYLNDGTKIHIFIDRVAAMAPAPWTGAVLGHVLAHEITHVLERIVRHSDTGIMKAHWDARDFRAMQSHPLPFASRDVLLLEAAGANPSSPSTTLAVN